jgi:predicted Rossmann fold nucleotide-binding protein DprA/Smf involved in DNA uptake
LFAVPGPLGSSASVGTNALIACGDARVLVSPEALLATRGLSGATAPFAADPVLAALAVDALDADALRRRVRMTDGDLAERLLRLELSGRIMKTPDGRYRAAS